MDDLTREPVTALSGRLPKWPTGTDCKSVGDTPSEVRILHRPPAGVMNVSPQRQALIAQLVERALGKGEVMGSIPIEGSNCRIDIKMKMI